MSLSDTQKEIQRLKVKKDLMIGLPHLFAFKFYKWARRIWESKDRIILLCAANQISKSSTMIRKNIELAGNPSLWGQYWLTPPKQFWYLYPSKEVATIEFEQKWVKEFLPRGSYKSHPTYGWTVVYANKHVHEIKFNSGVSLYFKTYTQDVQKLQTSTAHMITVDEELPVILFDELMFRLAAVDGIFMAAFTATLGQAFWYRAIEKIGTAHEEMVDAFKQQITMYDCLEYEDGSATPWTVEKINIIKNKCSTKAQIERRVYGKFVVDDGLMFKSFNCDRNCVTSEEFRKKNKIAEGGLIPREWEIYSAVDIGSGGSSHPAAVIFIAVRPDYRYGVAFKGKRFDDVGTTTCEDVLNGYRALRGSIRCTCQSYDWQAKDFSTYADRIGESFVKAEKSHAIGEDLVNVLFKNQLLDILINDPDDELNKLVMELESLKIDTAKTHAQDDFCFAAGTKIKTAMGEKVIEDISLNDYIITRNGFRKVLAISVNMGELHAYSISGSELISTPSHKIFSVLDKKFKKIKEWTLRDMPCTFNEWKQKQLHLTELNLEGTRNLKEEHSGCTSILRGNIGAKGLGRFIKKFGNTILVKFQKALLFIIKTKIRLIMKLKILSVFQDHNTLEIILIKDSKVLSIQTKITSILQESGNWHLSGTEVNRLRIFIKNLGKNLGKMQNTECLIASFAEKITQQGQSKTKLSFVQMPVNLVTEENPGLITKKESVLIVGKNLSLINIQKQQTALALALNPQISKVYNITVDVDHEYFANEILVSNCDSLRYASCSIPWDYTVISSEYKEVEEEKKHTPATEIEERRKAFETTDENRMETLDEEIEYYNDLYEL